MGIPGLWQIILVLVLVLLLFGGRGRISGLMGEFARGIRSFREGMSGDDDGAEGAPMRQVDSSQEEPSSTTTEEKNNSSS